MIYSVGGHLSKHTHTHTAMPYIVYGQRGVYTKSGNLLGSRGKNRMGLLARWAKRPLLWKKKCFNTKKTGSKYNN